MEAKEEGPKPVILVVDDEPAVRNLVCHMLESANYKVLAACNGVEALKLSDTCLDPIDLLLTDIEMPDMDGPELIVQMRTKRPRTKLMAMSGKDSSRLKQAAVQVPFLRKPFTLQSFLKKVEEVLVNHKVA